MRSRKCCTGAYWLIPSGYLKLPAPYNFSLIVFKIVLTISCTYIAWAVAKNPLLGYMQDIIVPIFHKWHKGLPAWLERMCFGSSVNEAQLAQSPQMNHLHLWKVTLASLSHQVSQVSLIFMPEEMLILLAQRIPDGATRRRRRRRSSNTKTTRRLQVKANILLQWLLPCTYTELYVVENSGQVFFSSLLRHHKVLHRGEVAWPQATWNQLKYQKLSGCEEECCRPDLSSEIISSPF
jgi:hypothetical protein